MALLAILVGIGVVIWLNGQGAPENGEIRRVTERPQLSNPREVVAAAEKRRAVAAARARARVRRVRAARVERRRRAALAAAAARRPYTGDERFSQYSNGYPIPGTQSGYPSNGQTYTQQQVQPTPAPAPAPRPNRNPSGPPAAVGVAAASSTTPAEPTHQVATRRGFR